MKKYTFIALIALASCSSDASDSTPIDIGLDTDGLSDVTQNDTRTDADVDSGDDTGSDTTAADMTADFDPNAPFGGDRPARVVLPTDYDPNGSYPLVTLLHGYTASAAIQDTYFGLSAEVDERQFILVLPDGLQDGLNNRYWNATPFCCGFNTERPDDVAYLTGLLDEAQTRYAVDASRVYFIGHSNGGFMSYTMACELGDRIAGIASLAGSTFVDDADCNDTGNVSVLQIHGTLDATIAYLGSVNQYPGAAEVMDRWVARNGCDATSTNAPSFDLEPAILGDETTVERWMNCEDDADVTFWTITGGSHVPTLTDFSTRVLDHLFARSKP